MTVHSADFDFCRSSPTIADLCKEGLTSRDTPHTNGSNSVSKVSRMCFNVFSLRVIAQLGYRLDYSSNNTGGWRKELHKHNSWPDIPNSGGIVSMSQFKAEAGSPSLIVGASDVSTYIYELSHLFLPYRNMSIAKST